MFRSALIAIFLTLAWPGGWSAGQEPGRDPRTDRANAKLDEAIAEAEEDYVRVQAEALADWLAVYEKAVAEARAAGDLQAAGRLEDAVARSKRAGRAILPAPKDVLQFQENRYAFLPELRTWDAARRHCEAMGGHLVTIESALEEDFVVRSFGKYSFFAGATDRKAEGKWIWLSGRPVGPFQHPAKLDDKKGLQHALLWHTDIDRWDDGDEGYPFGCVCEWER